MKTTLIRFALFATVTLVVAACSSGSSNHRTSAATETDGSGGGTTTPNTTATITGTAAAGLIVGGTVSVFPIVSGTVATSASGTSTTDSAGVYSVEIEDHEGAVKVVISATSSTTMICDAPAGCGGVAFGSSTPLSTDFTLSAMVPSVADAVTATAHITPLTHMAAVFAEEQSSITATVIQQAQSQLQSALGISFNILETAPIDITNTDNLTSVTEDQLNYSLFTAAIAGLAESEGSAGATFATNLDSILTSLAEDFAANNGQLFQSASSTGDSTTQVTLAEILAESINVITAIEETATDAGVTLSTAVTTLLDETEETLENDQTLAELNPGDLTEGEASATAGASDLDKAKGIVADFQVIADVLGDEDGDLGDTLDDHFAAIDNFADGLGLREMNLALADVVNALLAGTTLPTEGSYQGASYTISMTGGSIPSTASTSQMITLPTGTITSAGGNTLTVKTGSMLTATYATSTLLDSEMDLDTASSYTFTLMADIGVVATDADLDTFDGSLTMTLAPQSSCSDTALSAYNFTGQFSSSAESNNHTFNASLDFNISNASCSTLDLAEGTLNGDATLLFQSNLSGSEFTLLLSADFTAGEEGNWSVMIRTGSVTMNIEEGTDSWVFENQDDVMLTLNIDDEDEITSNTAIGSITLGGTTHGAVTRSDSTGYIATFTDNVALSFP
ncbi:MAG: hypothetical protein COB51_00745 [Moraxellaceae bacterium]|nr:MAG: hypothetical protein COB51_00745 [Moraxellaceae bacterium]